MRPSSSSSSSTSQSQVTQQEFFSFHNIDRQLFFRLVFNLRREPSETMQAMAFWLWLERIHKSTCVNIILTYPDPIIDAVFEETLMALRAAEDDEYHPSNDTYDIPILQNIVGKERVSLKYFYENRITVLLNVGNIIQQVCLRAFQDIIRMISKYRSLPPQHYHASSNFPRGNMNAKGNTGSAALGITTYHPSFKVGDFSVLVQNPFLFSSIEGSPNPNKGSSSNNVNNILTDYVPPGLHDNLTHLFAQMRMSENYQSQENVIPQGERTIFLTFSKGYPITEHELRDFLHRSFGDIIETLYMQEVPENEQPLYARLVVRDARLMDVVLSGKVKVKFSINGKHVWGRKYVRKNPNSPPSSPIKLTV